MAYRTLPNGEQIAYPPTPDDPDGAIRFRKDSATIRATQASEKENDRAGVSTDTISTTQASSLAVGPTKDETQISVLTAPFLTADFAVSRAILPEGILKLLKDDKNPSFEPSDLYRNGVAKIDDGKKKTLQFSKLPTIMTEKEPLQASIRLIKRSSDGKSYANTVPRYTKFFLSSVQEARQEKVQITETFYDWYAFFFGERPPIYTYAGELINSEEHQWRNDFMFYYLQYFRGTSAVNLKSEVAIVYDDVLVTGYLLNISSSQQAVVPTRIPFSMNLLVTRWAPLKFSADFVGSNAELQDQLAASTKANTSRSDILKDAKLEGLTDILKQGITNKNYQFAVAALNKKTPLVTTKKVV